MRRSVILDAGVLAAILRRRDQYHPWASAMVKEVVAPMLTCEAVLSEAHFLLRDMPLARRAISEMSEKRIFIVAFSHEEQKAFIGKLLEKYADVPMSFADACLVRMSEFIRIAPFLRRTAISKYTGEMANSRSR